MSGDPLRQAFRDKLQAVIDASAIPWGIEDTLNTGDQPDVGTSFIDLEFPGGQESDFTFGSPGSNFFKETGQVMIRLLPSRSSGHELAETYGLLIRNAFRHARFTMSTGQTVQVTAVAPMGGGFLDTGWWCETVAVAYRVFNQG